MNESEGSTYCHHASIYIKFSLSDVSLQDKNANRLLEYREIYQSEGTDSNTHT